jgi:hypothetical protein
MSFFLLLKQIRSWILVIDQDPNEHLLKEKNNKPLSSGKYIEDCLKNIIYRECLF